MSRNLLSRWIGVTALVLATSTPPAQAQSVFDACETDIQSYCADVTPGNGRLTACMYAHEDKLSESCDAAVGEMADIIDVVFERLRYVKQQCGADIATLCSDVAIGQGRVFSCLHENRSSLSASCVGVVDSVQLPKE